MTERSSKITFVLIDRFFENISGKSEKSGKIGESDKVPLEGDENFKNEFKDVIAGEKIKDAFNVTYF